MSASYRLGELSVQRIGFGAMQLAGPGVFGPPRDWDQAVAVLRRAVELGVNHIDTAQYYGPDVANELIHQALHPYPADLVLVSKVGARRDEKGGWFPANRPEELRAGIEANLRSLRVDQLGAVNLRVMDADRATDMFDDQLDAMVQAREEGLIAGIGLSNVSHDRLLRALGRTPVVCVQNQFNLVERGALPVLVECTARGIAFVPFFPLGSGFPGQNRVLDHPALTAVAGRLGATPAQIALAWILALAPNTLLIPGTSSIVHLEQNLAAGSLELAPEDLTALDAA